MGSKIIAASLSLVLFVTNCTFAHSVETNFWKERQKAVKNPPVQLAFNALALPALKNQNLELPTLNLTPRKRNIPGLNISLPLQYGSLRSVLTPPKGMGSGQVVIHIQDVHMNREAQANIGKTIESLLKEGKGGLVALEGASEPIDLAPFKEFPNQQTLRKVADHALGENKISGPIHAALTSPYLPSIIGVDDQQHYQANIDAYRTSSKQAEELKVTLGQQKLVLQKEKASTYNSDLARFDLTRDAYLSGHLSMGDFVNVLGGEGSLQTFREALSLEKSLNFQQVERERTQLIERLLPKLKKVESQELIQMAMAYRLGQVQHADFYEAIQTLCSKGGVPLEKFPSMNRYIHYVLLSESIDGEKLHAEIHQQQEKIYASLVGTPQERDLIEKSKRLELTEKLVNFSLTAGEWEEYRKTVLGTENLTSFENFYCEAEIRDQLMARKFLDLSGKVQGRLSASPVILVTGGFHSAGIDKILTEAGVTVLTFVPKITKLDSENGNAYLSIFNQEKAPLEKLFEGQKLFLAKNPMSGSQSLEMALQMSSIEILKNNRIGAMKNWLSRFFKMTEIRWSIQGSILELYPSISGTNGRIFPTKITLSIVGAVPVIIGAAVVTSWVWPVSNIGLSSVYSITPCLFLFSLMLTPRPSHDDPADFIRLFALLSEDARDVLMNWKYKLGKLDFSPTHNLSPKILREIRAKYSLVESFYEGRGESSPLMIAIYWNFIVSQYRKRIIYASFRNTTGPIFWIAFENIKSIQTQRLFHFLVRNSHGGVISLPIFIEYLVSLRPDNLFSILTIHQILSGRPSKNFKWTEAMEFTLLAIKEWIESILKRGLNNPPAIAAWFVGMSVLGGTAFSQDFGASVASSPTSTNQGSGWDLPFWMWISLSLGFLFLMVHFFKRQKGGIQSDIEKLVSESVAKGPIITRLKGRSKDLSIGQIQALRFVLATVHLTPSQQSQLQSLIYEAMEHNEYSINGIKTENSFLRIGLISSLIVGLFAPAYFLLLSVVLIALYVMGMIPQKKSQSNSENNKPVGLSPRLPYISKWYQDTRQRELNYGDYEGYAVPARHWYRLSTWKSKNIAALGGFLEEVVVRSFIQEVLPLVYILGVAFMNGYSFSSLSPPEYENIIASYFVLKLLIGFLWTLYFATGHHKKIFIGDDPEPQAVPYLNRGPDRSLHTLLPGPRMQLLGLGVKGSLITLLPLAFLLVASSITDLHKATLIILLVLMIASYIGAGILHAKHNLLNIENGGPLGMAGAGDESKDIDINGLGDDALLTALTGKVSDDVILEILRRRELVPFTSFGDLETLPGVGKGTKKILQKLGIKFLNPQNNIAERILAASEDTIIEVLDSVQFVQYRYLQTHIDESARKRISLLLSQVSPQKLGLLDTMGIAPKLKSPTAGDPIDRQSFRQLANEVKRGKLSLSEVGQKYLKHKEELESKQENKQREKRKLASKTKETSGLSSPVSNEIPKREEGGDLVARILLAEDLKSEEAIQGVQSVLTKFPDQAVLILTDNKNVGHDKGEFKKTLLEKKPHIIVLKSGVKVFHPDPNQGGDPEFWSIARDAGVRVIVRAGVGTDNIDLAAADKNGISVIRTHGSANSVGELAMRFLIDGLRKLYPSENDAGAVDIAFQREWNQVLALLIESQFRKGLDKSKSDKNRMAKMDPALADHIFNGVFGTLSKERATELFKHLEGKTIGVVGFGPIAIEFIQKLNALKALLGIEFTIQVTFRSIEKGSPSSAMENMAKSLNVVLVNKTTLIQTSDVLSLHIPGDEKTKGYLSAQDLEGSNIKIIINTSRESLMDPDLFQSAPSFYYYADVDLTDELVDRQTRYPSKVFLTPHIGASTPDATQGVLMNLIPILESSLNILLKKFPAASIDIVNRVPLGLLPLLPFARWARQALAREIKLSRGMALERSKWNRPRTWKSGTVASIGGFVEEVVFRFLFQELLPVLTILGFAFMNGNGFSSLSPPFAVGLLLLYFNIKLILTLLWPFLFATVFHPQIILGGDPTPHIFPMFNTRSFFSFQAPFPDHRMKLLELGITGSVITFIPTLILLMASLTTPMSPVIFAFLAPTILSYLLAGLFHSYFNLLSIKTNGPLGLAGADGLTKRKTILTDTQSNKLEKKLKSIERSFTPTTGQLLKVQLNFLQQMNSALLGFKSSLRMILTHAVLPTGKEKGKYLVVNWGGSNGRVFSVDLLGNGKYEVGKPRMVWAKNQLQEMRSNPDRVFAKIAETILRITKGDSTTPYKINFTYSFDHSLESLDTAIAAPMSKGWREKALVGKNLGKRIEEELSKLGKTNYQVTSVANDTLSPLFAWLYQNAEKLKANLMVVMGVILGTGHNIAVVIDGKIWNMESGNFNGVRRIHNRFDRTLDKSIKNPSPGKQLFEKMIAGEYMGELVRRAMKELKEESGLFQWGRNSPFAKKNGFTSLHLSKVLNSNKRVNAGAWRSLGVSQWSDSEKQALRRVSLAVVKRAARVLAIAFAGIIEKVDPEYQHEHVIPVEGSVFWGVPGFQQLVHEALIELMGDIRAKKISFAEMKDSMAGGGAVVAAAGARIMSPTLLSGILILISIAVASFFSDAGGVAMASAGLIFGVTPKKNSREPNDIMDLESIANTYVQALVSQVSGVSLPASAIEGLMPAAGSLGLNGQSTLLSLDESQQQRLIELIQIKIKTMNLKGMTFGDVLNATLVTEGHSFEPVAGLVGESNLLLDVNIQVEGDAEKALPVILAALKSIGISSNAKLYIPIRADQKTDLEKLLDPVSLSRIQLIVNETGFHDDPGVFNLESVFEAAPTQLQGVFVGLQGDYNVNSDTLKRLSIRLISLDKILDGILGGVVIPLEVQEKILGFTRALIYA